MRKFRTEIMELKSFFFDGVGQFAKFGTPGNAVPVYEGCRGYVFSPALLLAECCEMWLGRALSNTRGNELPARCFPQRTPRRLFQPLLSPSQQ